MKLNLEITLDSEQLEAVKKTINEYIAKRMGRLEKKIEKKLKELEKK